MAAALKNKEELDRKRRVDDTKLGVDDTKTKDGVDEVTGPAAGPEAPPSDPEHLENHRMTKKLESVHERLRAIDTAKAPEEHTKVEAYADSGANTSSSNMVEYS